MRLFKSLGALCAALVFNSTCLAVISADQVVSYSTGSPIQTAWWNPSLSYTDSSAAIGLPDPFVGNDPFTDLSTGAMTPFNPPFYTNHIVRVSAGGNIELKLSSAVNIGPGRELGVFSNNGIADVTPGTTFDDNFVCISGGTGTAPTYVSNPEEILFSPAPMALVYVKLLASDAWTQVGSAPISFPIPTNAYTDTLIDKLFAPLGTQLANLSQPFTGTLADFSGKTYPQMLTMLNGSAGGTWIDLDSTGLPSVQYVKFEVPTGANYRMMLDAVTAVPEPGCTLALLLSGTILLHRRRGA